MDIIRKLFQFIRIAAIFEKAFYRDQQLSSSAALDPERPPAFPVSLSTHTLFPEDPDLEPLQVLFCELAAGFSWKLDLKERVVWVYDDDNDDFEIGHVSQSSCDSEMEQGLTDTDTENADFLDSND
ncbi:hypothetical protein H920_18768 [Fukomys damarensis]|uniref:Uncharacterized protein n=1 Tax=Fukomys damarensis TaxID=885580 RepID=A0A091DAS1_FUKDA|nr:hypothetical protein H920_18768 [Fukomys damarensis]